MRIDLLKIKSLASTVLSWPRWVKGGFNLPVPRRIKWKVLLRYSKTGGTWIESGTYLGDTTKFLAKQADNVISIEPSEYLVKRARARLRKFENVRIVHGLSEQNLSTLLTDISGPVYFWLDGHASGGYTHTGPQITPIRQELEIIESMANRLSAFSVFIDDWRGFESSEGTVAAYPARFEIVEWARRCHLHWTVEFDIFVAWK